MRRSVFRYLREHYSAEPRKVDRLLVSAYLKTNNISLRRNQLLKGYQIKEGSKEYSNLEDFLTLIAKEHIKLTLEELIKFFEFVISPEDKIITGAVYTPERIRDYIVDQTLKKSPLNTSNLKIADISCGCGGFLLSAAIKLHKVTNKSFAEIYRNNIYGLDIQGYSITRTKLMLTLLAVSRGEDILNFNFRLFTGDALKFKWQKVISNFSGFDTIIGNPPYVCSRNISESTRKHLKHWEVCKTGHPDLYIPFIQIGLENLKNSGFLGYITMNTFFKSVNGRALRSYLQEKSYKLKVLDFGNKQIFESKSTYTCIFLIEKKKSYHLGYILDERLSLPINKGFSKIKFSSLNAINGWNLQEVDRLTKIESTGIPFGALYKTRNGIATLKNDIYIFDPVKEDRSYYYLQNGSLFQIEKGICKDIINPNKLIQTDTVDELKRKVLFPYLFTDEGTELINEFHLKKDFPKAYAYLTAKKNILATRDKGNGNYEQWFAFGRNQSIEKIKHKLLFPHISPDIPKFVINSDENLLFYNGLAVVTDSEDELGFLKKLLSSNLFWFYIKNSSKPYGSGYYSLSRNYIKNFGIYPFTTEQKKFIRDETDMKAVNEFIESKYAVKLSL